MRPDPFSRAMGLGTRLQQHDLSSSVYSCVHTEAKLGKLQGSDKQQLTSKDIINSITEARDDHMRQFLTTEATNDPWMSSPTSIRNEYADFEVAEVSRGEQKYPIVWGCCCCGQRGRPSYARARRTQSLDEENVCLVDCDELNLAWQREPVT